MNKLEYTGERLVPGVYGKTSIEHLHRYALSIDFLKDKKVLDIACGEGYGSNLLAEYAKQVKGVDISKDVILHAKATYKKENLDFMQGSVLDIPFENNSFDLVVSFETLEHVSDHQKMISEINRILKPEGILIISTPEKSVYSELVNYSNPFHEKELIEEEFIDLIKHNFEFHQLFHQKYLMGSLILSSQINEGIFKLYSGDYTRLNFNRRFKNEYMIIICSNKEISNVNFNSFFSSEDIDKLRKDKIKVNKLGFRYRLINFFFKPWDIIKEYMK